MNHKLNNTILASAVVGAALLFGLLAAQPVQDHRPSARHGLQSQGYSAGKLLAAGLSHELGREIQARASGIDAGPIVNASRGEALALASVLLASSVVEATVASMLEEAGNRQPPVRGDGGAHGEVRSGASRSRAALAMPYFSSARGPRRGGGE